MTADPGHFGDDDSETRCRLRADPPPCALRWLEETLGDVRVVDVVAMRGGSSAAMHLVTTVDAQDRSDQVVLRRYLQADQQAENPSCALLEANALTHMAPTGVPTPDLVAVDAAGDHAGAPAVVMTKLDGRPRWDNRDRHYWAHVLAELVAAIHTGGLPAPGSTRDYACYRQQSYRPPPWASDPRVWEQAAEIFHGPIPSGRSFIHRDFHPGNVLWRGRRLTGVIDWESASIGPPDVDIGHCRLNFLFQTPALARLLAHAWNDVTGTSYNPWADIAAIIGILDSLRSHPPAAPARFALEDTLARAVTDLGTR